MSAPWGGPPPPDRRGYQDFVGRPVITIVGGVRLDVPGQWGSRDIPHVTIVSLVGPDAGHVYNDLIVWTSRIAGRLRGCEPGSVILSKVVDKGKAPDLDDPDQWDQQAATAWFNANPGALDALKHGAMTDFRNYLAQNGNGGQPSYQQPQYPPQGGPVNPAYAQQPQFQAPAQQPQYAPQTSAPAGQWSQPQPQYQAPAPQHQTQLREAVAQPSPTLASMTPSTPPPPDQAPPAFYGPPPTQSVDSARNAQSDEPPF